MDNTQFSICNLQRSFNFVQTNNESSHEIVTLYLFEACQTKNYTLR